MNHSIIEKARRTKINDALATLRVLVPASNKRSQDPDEEEDELMEEGKGKKGDEKEFKLDVLVRTVSFLQELTDKIKILEHGGCSKCSTRWDTVPKRKRSDVEEADVVDDETQGDQEEFERASESDMHINVPNAGHDAALALITRLPPIASWLHPSMDPSNLAFNPIRSPMMITSLKNDPHVIHQLPSPPTSTHFYPSVTALVPPALTLPSPRTSVSLVTSTRPASLSHPESANTSPMLSPTRTAEDESAASMLLLISSSSYRSSSSSERSCSDEYQRDNTGGVSEQMQPLTPSSMLGLRMEGER
jgi:hypothetical protein